MTNFCTNCGNKLRKDDNFCTNCGTIVRKNNNFCTNCGNRLRKDDNFCTNCGTKIYNSDINENKSAINTMAKNEAKKELRRAVGGIFLYNKNFVKACKDNDLDFQTVGKSIKRRVGKEIETGQIKKSGVGFRVYQLIDEYKIKMDIIDEIFESDEIKSLIKKYKIDQKYVDPYYGKLKESGKPTLYAWENKGEEEVIRQIKNKTSRKIFDNLNETSEYEIKNCIINELKNEGKAREERKKQLDDAIRWNNEQIRQRQEQERIREELIKNGIGGYCGFSCRYFREEYLDKFGGVVADPDPEGAGVQYFCDLGGYASPRSFCADYTE